MVLHVRRSQMLKAVFHAISENTYDTEHLGTGFPLRIHNIDNASSGRDQVLYYNDLLTRFQFPLDAVFLP